MPNIPAALAAYHHLASQGVTALPVQPLALLTAHRDTLVLTRQEAEDALSLPPETLDRLMDAADAVTFREDLPGRTRYIVVYRPGGHPARLRFTLAHELGHLLLGHRTRTPREEREADLFASHLLCPQPVIARLARRFAPLTAETVAAACYVSRACARALSRRAALPPDPAVDAVDGLLGPAADTLMPIAAQPMQHCLRIPPE